MPSPSHCSCPYHRDRPRSPCSPASRSHALGLAPTRQVRHHRQRPLHHLTIDPCYIGNHAPISSASSPGLLVFSLPGALSTRCCCQQLVVFLCTQGSFSATFLGLAASLFWVSFTSAHHVFGYLFHSLQPLATEHSLSFLQNLAVIYWCPYAVTTLPFYRDHRNLR
jgi:hypothetical protein